MTTFTAVRYKCRLLIGWCILKYDDFSREQLLKRLEELEILNQQLLKEKEQETRLEFAGIGYLGHWYWNIKTNNVIFDPLKIINLGYEGSEIPQSVTYQYIMEMLHPEDYSKTIDSMNEHLYGNTEVFEAEYRIRTKDGGYKWHYDRAKVTRYDSHSKPVFVAGVTFDVTERKEMQLEMERKNSILSEMSCTDGLTKLKNRRALIEHLKMEIAEYNRSGKTMSIAMFDVDNFKKVNDTKGHVFGDKVLVDIANILQQSIRGTDIAGRYGGEEFVVVLSNANTNNAGIAAERIRKSVERFDFGEGMKITISGGVKEYQGEEIPEFINAADVNLYKAKQQGKNQIVF